MVACAALATGCYTLLKHPRPVELSYRRPAPDRPCTDCHSSAAVAGYLNPQHLRPSPHPWDALERAWWSQVAPSDSAGGNDAAP